jgi:hypothetical protein
MRDDEFQWERHGSLMVMKLSGGLDAQGNRASGKVRVTRAVSAVDVGQIVNPDGVVNQIEGGIIQSRSWTWEKARRARPPRRSPMPSPMRPASACARCLLHRSG